MNVVIADDTVLLREGVARLLTDAGFTVAATVGDADSLLTAVTTLHPDIAIIDVRMPPTHTTEGLTAALTIRAHHPDTAVLVLSQYVEPYYADRLIGDDVGPSKLQLLLTSANPETRLRTARAADFDSPATAAIVSDRLFDVQGGRRSDMLRRVDLSAGQLSEGEWPAARGLLHRAFANEPFTVEMYGLPPLERWGGSWDLYSSVRSADYSLALAVRLRDVLVGVALGSTPGHCHLCQVQALEVRPEDRYLAIDWEYNQNIAEQHSALGEHAWVTKVAVEPALHGLGIGRRLFESVTDALRVEAPTEVVLECAPDRLTFYRRLGYEQVATFADPAGPDASLMRQWIR